MNRGHSKRQAAKPLSGLVCMYSIGGASVCLSCAAGDGITAKSSGAIPQFGVTLAMERMLLVSAGLPGGDHRRNIETKVSTSATMTNGFVGASLDRPRPHAHSATH